MTIRLRLTFWYTALLGTTLILFSVVVYSALANNLRVQVEQDAARQANEVASALAQQLQFDVLIIRNSPTRVQIPELDFFASASGVQLVGLDGMILKRSSTLGATTVPEFRTALEPLANDKSMFTTQMSETDTQLLVYSVPLITGDAVIGAVQVIKSVTARGQCAAPGQPLPDIGHGAQSDTWPLSSVHFWPGAHLPPSTPSPKPPARSPTPEIWGNA